MTETQGQTNLRKIGTEYEARAAQYLEARDFQIVERNFRCRAGEIDLIGWDAGTLVFIEVKYRTSRDRMYALSAVNWRKQRTISRVAHFYMLRRHIGENTPCRFDVVAFSGGDMTHIKNAFDFRP